MARDLGRIGEAIADRFRIVECISEGGMATVYLADDLKHRRQVALKILEGDAPGDGETARFEREIETIARLRHPHILPLHDSGRVDGRLYFVMPHMPEGTLRDRLKREGPLPVEEALRIAREVAEALARAHAEGVIHRDVKPENIMMDSGHAVVSDFGIALLAEGQEGERLTGRGSSPATPAYMSPEQAVGDEVVDHRTDIYSLGCVLYEMLAGDPPFPGSRGRAIVARKLVDPAPPVRVVREGVPEAVERLTLKALSRVPADRHRSAAEVAERLARLESAVRAAGPEGADLPVEVAWARSPGRLAALAGVYGACGVLLLGVIGLLTTRVFDLKIQVPPEYAPTRSDYLVVGAQAVFPLLVFGLLALGLSFVFLRYVLPLARPRRTREPEREPDDNARSTWERIAGRRPTRTVEDLFVLAMVAVSVAAFWPFRQIYLSLLLPGTRVFACGSRDLHLLHLVGMPALIVALGVTRYTLFRWLRGRGTGARGWTVARVASGVWLAILVLTATLPWRVLFDSYYERIRIGGEQAYLLAEGGDGTLLAYTPSTGSAQRFEDPGAELERLGVVGYLFEEPVVFESGQPRCASTLTPTP